MIITSINFQYIYKIKVNQLGIQTTLAKQEISWDDVDICGYSIEIDWMKMQNSSIWFNYKWQNLLNK